MAVALRIGKEVELLLLGRSPRQPQRLRLVPLLRVSRPAQIQIVPVPLGGALVQVVELVRRLALIPPLTEGAEEPQTILPDRTAQRHAGIVDVVQAVDAFEAARDQLVAEV